MLRGRSKDRTRKVTPPGPVYMSNDQFAQYLSDLRNNRVGRPSGARPPPPSKRRESDRGATTTPQPVEVPEAPFPDPEVRSASVLSHRRAQSSLSTYSSVTSRTGRQVAQPPRPAGDRILKPSEVVPSATYIERGQRWMEKEEVVSLRDAMQDMDIKNQEEEEARIHAAAQDEASELVWQHQNPAAAVKPDAPYRYRGHLRKNSYQHARTQSVGRYSGVGMADALNRRSVSGSSSNSGGMHSQRGRVSSGSSGNSQGERNISPEPAGRTSLDNSKDLSQSRTQKSYGSISGGGRPDGGSRRKSSAKRNISGEVAGTFTSDQIWEEPEQEDGERGRSQDGRDMPAPLRIKPRNPLNRVQFVQDLPARSNSTPPEIIKPLSQSEIHRNPPSQSRNPNYTANTPPAAQTPERKSEEAERPPVPMKDGLEIRSDEIRQATSMRLKDRSPKLPTPTVVSDKPGRPIVSFDANWKLKEADVKPEVRRRSPFDRFSSSSQRQSLPARKDSKDVSTPIPTIHVPDTPSIEVNQRSAITVPIINFPDSAPSVPTINLPDSTPRIPTINIPDAPAISVSAPEISVSDMSKDSRPLPDPKKVGGRPQPRAVPINRGHWSPAAGKRATLLCHQCQLPIEGRSLFVTGQPERFHPTCFICFTCGTSLESLDIHTEPSTKRSERLDRIKRRARGENIPDVEGQTMAEDGDERLRLYCDLDWHENFAPRCKHCTTPIHGEHLIALGAHWHYDHFFCAECGDPFGKGVSHIEKDGYAWCLNCQTKRTERRAPKCKKCKKPVIGEYVQALGGEWHEKCFRCANCKGAFVDGAFYPKEVGEETLVLCIKCIERELKA